MSRIFVALSPDSKLKAEINRASVAWRDQLNFAKWVHQDDLHLTLKFIGEADQQELPAIIRKLAAIAAAQRPLTLTIAAPGTFGDPRSPSILWRGLEGDLAALSVLQENVESAMESLGFQREKRPFRPHLTLARKYKNSAPFQPQLLEQYRLQAQPLDWDVSGLVLLQTRFGRSPMYEEVQQFVFGLQTPD